MVAMMTNRKLAYIIKDQNPLVMPTGESVQHACKLMWERRPGSVLVVDDGQRLIGIFNAMLSEPSHKATMRRRRASIGR